MLILFDHGAPRGLARAFAGHTVITAKARGWDRLSKGAFLTASEAAGIDLLLTPSSGPYLVCGKKVDHFFAGVDSLAHEEKVHVVARWAHQTRINRILRVVMESQPPRPAQDGPRPSTRRS